MPPCTSYLSQPSRNQVTQASEAPREDCFLSAGPRPQQRQDTQHEVALTGFIPAAKEVTQQSQAATFRHFLSFEDCSTPVSS